MIYIISFPFQPTLHFMKSVLLAVLFPITILGLYAQSIYQIDVIAGQEPANYEQRFQAVKDLTNGELILKKEDYIAFLADKALEDSLSAAELYAIKNNLIDRMLRISELRSALIPTFAQTLADREYSYIWRDYMTQKVPRIYKDISSQNTKLELLDELWQNLNEPKGTLAGTTLICLMRLSQESNQVSKRLVSNKALQILYSNHYGTGNRMTAISVASALGGPEMGIAARKILESDEPILIKLGALQALAKHDGKNSQDLIESYLSHSDYRMRKAAQSALQ